MVLQNDFEKHLTKLSFHCVSPTQFNNLVQNIKNSVFHSEKQFERKRNFKLDKLKNNHIFKQNFAKVHNETGVVIPSDILSLPHIWETLFQ